MPFRRMRTSIGLGVIFLAHFNYAASPSTSSPSTPQYQPIAIEREYPSYNVPVTSTVSETEAIVTMIRKRNAAVSSPQAQLIAQCIVESGQRQKIDPKLIAAVISVESAFNSRASHGGAMGLGQLMGATARRVGIQDPFSVTQNVEGTTRYIRSLLDAWTGHPQQLGLALASYLVGPNRINPKRGVSGRIHRYVDSVLWHYDRAIVYRNQILDTPKTPVYVPPVGPLAE
ncbi:lytic transglycosylase domain-containing protein [bacterium]|nr:lytic transglycosylase domain-containing protein [bacterium]